MSGQISAPLINSGSAIVNGFLTLAASLRCSNSAFGRGPGNTKSFHWRVRTLIHANSELTAPEQITSLLTVTEGLYRVEFDETRLELAFYAHHRRPKHAKP